MRLHESGELVEAEQAYRRVLDANPRNPQALYLRGVVTGQLGRPHDAIELLQQAVSLRPDHLQAISELAKLFQETGQLQASAEALRKLISVKPDLGELYNNLGIVLRRLGKPKEAAVACGKAVELSPDSAEAHSNLADVLRRLERFDGAAAAYRRAIVLRPGLTDVYRRLAAVLVNSDKLDEATDVLRQWLSHEPDNPIVQHMLAAYCGEKTPTRASDDYVRRVFDEFAATFDGDLRELDHQGPRLIGEAVTAELDEGAEGLDVLDAGCGTGLCGPLLRPIARRLIGVDLSAVMIQHARGRNLYDDLVEGELTEYLNDHPGDFDLIVGADTFNYFGALEPLLTAAACALRERGILVYTLEKYDTSTSVADYRLNPHGRYSHNEDYVKGCMDERGLIISSMESAALRKERNQPVAGIIVRARKQGS
jgi:predicted TPR repeat methyltransferase